MKKLIAHLKSKGIRTMMWGDIVLKYPDTISEIATDVVFLNWDYRVMPNEENIAIFQEKNCLQIVCPGSHGWNGFTENILVEEKNIAKMAAYGYQYGATGMLHTNWGDYGNLCPLSLSLYGLIVAAAISWNRETEINQFFRQKASVLFYGDASVLDCLSEIDEMRETASWAYLMKWSTESEPIDIRALEKTIQICHTLREKVDTLHFHDKAVCENFKIAADGYALLAKWIAQNQDVILPCYVDFNTWLEQFTSAWLAEGKPAELHELIRIFKAKEEGMKEIL